MIDPATPLSAALVTGVLLTSALGLAAPALATTPTPTPTTSVSDGGDCLPLGEGRFAHHFDADAHSLTVTFVPTDPGNDGRTLCDGGQAFTVATWALQESAVTTVPQRKIDAVEQAVTVAGEQGRKTITATDAGDCSVQVDGYMAAAADVPDVLTGFSGQGGNEPPLVNQKNLTPYPSDGNPAYSSVPGSVCTAPVEVVAKSECVEGQPVGGVILTSTNPWTVGYTVSVNGEPLETTEPVPPLEPGTSVAVAIVGPAGTYTVTVTDDNGVETSVDVTTVQCPTGTTVPATTEPTTVPATTEPTTVPATTEPTTVPATTEPTTVPTTVPTTTDQAVPVPSDDADAVGPAGREPGAGDHHPRPRGCLHPDGRAAAAGVHRVAGRSGATGGAGTARARRRPHRGESPPTLTGCHRFRHSVANRESVAIRTAFRNRMAVRR